MKYFFAIEKLYTFNSASENMFIFYNNRHLNNLKYTEGNITRLYKY